MKKLFSYRVSDELFEGFEKELDLKVKMCKSPVWVSYAGRLFPCGKCPVCLEKKSKFGVKCEL